MWGCQEIAEEHYKDDAIAIRDVVTNLMRPPKLDAFRRTLAPLSAMFNMTPALGRRLASRSQGPNWLSRNFGLLAHFEDGERRAQSA